MALIYLQNGGFVYYLINGIAVAGILAVMWIAASFAVRIRDSNANRPAHEVEPVEHTHLTSDGKGARSDRDGELGSPD
jgi:hypothetical protein